MSASPSLHIVLRPHVLPAAPRLGRAVVLDVAFAVGRSFDTVTRPFLTALGGRLALWVDHHDHDAWRDYHGVPSFVLVGKQVARACPQLIDPSLVEATGQVDHIIAHGDFDGAMAAAKFLRQGHAPYAEADEDARFSDAPGHGFTCSPRGLRLLKAFDQAQVSLREADYQRFVVEVVEAWVTDRESPSLAHTIESLGRQHALRVAQLAPLLAQAVQPVAGLLLLHVPAKTPNADKKFLLRQMEERARVAMVYDGEQLTVATYDDEGEAGLDLAGLKGLRGQRGYAWGKRTPAQVLPHVVAALRASPLGCT